MAKRKNSMKRHVARAFNHLDAAIEQLAVASKLACEVDGTYDEVFYPIAETVNDAQMMIKYLWETFWGEFPEDIRGYL